MEKNIKGLEEMDRSGYEVVKGEPDIRGWDVRNNAGKKIGEVEELIIDTKAFKVRYLVVDLKKNDLDLNQHRVLLPIGLAELHSKDDDVILPGIDAAQLRSLPEYDRKDLNRSTERHIHSILNSSATAQSAEDDDEQLYRHQHYSTDNFYKQRMHQAQPASDKRNTKEESEYEKGLRLWEKRSEGGIVPDDRSRNSGWVEKDVPEERRLQMIRDRRSQYEQRRGNTHYNDRPHHKDRSIEGRIRDEGLQDG